MATVKASPALLPVTGISQPGLTVRAAREKLKMTLQLVDLILRGPLGLPTEVRRALYDVRYHVLSGISLADDYIGAGYNHTDFMENVGGLPESIRNHLLSVRRAKAAWNQWAAQERTSATVHGSSLIPQVPEMVTSQIKPAITTTVKKTSVGAVEDTVKPVVSDFSKPTSVWTYIGIAAAAAVGLTILKVF